MTEQEFKSAQKGTLVLVEGIGTMQIWEYQGEKCLRDHGMMGYSHYEITDYSQITIIDDKNV